MGSTNNIKEKKETKKVENIKKENKNDKKMSEKKIKLPKTKIQKLKINHIKLILLIFLLFILLVILFVISKNINHKKDNNNSNNVTNNESNNIVEENKEVLKIYNIESNERPVAVMISNDSSAKKRQYGLQKAYLVYEITVEGGITRLMALYKDTNVEKIGPVRSSRHYYLDYVLESDAIYTHYGWSTYAQSDISSLEINNLNGLYNPSNMFYRDENYSSPNNAYTSTEKIKKAIETKKYRNTSEDYELLKYKNEVDLTKDETHATATNVKVNYGGNAYVKYVYDAENKYYLRFNNENKNIDLINNEQITVKNILVLKMDTKTIPNDEYGRQNLYNIGSGEGYYISNGEAIKITWAKEKRNSKTIYRNIKGDELEINDGNTFIQIQPTNKSLIIE